MIYFRHEILTRHITRIRGAIGENMYLITGTDRALLIDTGCGLGNISEYVKTLTDLPLTVVVTHGHYDHCGGMYTFPEVYLPEGELIHGFVGYTYEKGKSVVETRNLDIPDCDIVRDWDMSFQKLESGMIFNLGDASVEVISCPGHTPNCMTMLILPERLLMVGDACHSITYLHFPTCLSVRELAENLKKLIEREEEWDSLLLSHPVDAAPKTLIHQIISRCEEVLAGRAEIVTPFDDTGKHFVASKEGELGQLLYSTENLR